MNIDGPTLIKQTQRFYAAHGPLIPQVEKRYGLPQYLLYAVGSRETNLAAQYETQPGDGGHGWGPWQLDNRSHPDAAKHTVAQYADIAGKMLRDLIAHYAGNVHSACSAYNAGIAGADRGIRRGDSDLFTTGHDYARDVLQRMAYIHQNAH